ncbi:hypothetical protein I6B53_01450 [Schaalia sp. 19OD2882]|uniref:hypothetical protein n=1 Tax=Schaalia sp. 19OD2882 TaxID=2794089 RepID=UPI001C1F1D96|nr:hypothetical protein [Schaalia sp. 19OD2882]QWW19824.1 hypothetical protein I6B53_01450 [Schaalia sp. 19OD2882]
MCTPLGPALPPLAGPEDIITIIAPLVGPEEEAQIEAWKVENGHKCEFERTNRLGLLLIVLVLDSTTLLALGAGSSSKDQRPCL